MLVALLLQSPSDTAGAAPDAAVTTARLELTGAADCISRNELAARVAARSARIQFADDAAIVAAVAIASARPANVVAELVLSAAGIEPVPRRIVARSCAEAADAVALMIAVTLDPTSAPTITPDQPVTAPEPPVTVEAPVPPAPVTSEAARRRFAAYVAGETIFGPAPAVMPGIALHGMAALERDGVWAPAVFIGLTHAWRSELSQPGGAASFTLDAASVDACPLRFGGSRLVVRPCASALVGRLASAGSDTEQGASAARPYSAAGAALTATLGTTVELYARLGIGVTLLRDSYELGGMIFHRAGQITTTASLGVGLHWPR